MLRPLRQNEKAQLLHLAERLRSIDFDATSDAIEEYVREDGEGWSSPLEFLAELRNTFHWHFQQAGDEEDRPVYRQAEAMVVRAMSDLRGLAKTSTEKNPAKKRGPKFDVWTRDGTRVYSGLVRVERGYSWPDGFGWITDETIRQEGWIVKPAAPKQKAVQGSLFDTAPPSRQGKLFDNPGRRPSTSSLLRRHHRDRLHGGRADGRQPSEFDPRQLRMGIKVEREHTDDPNIALEIAMDHLAEGIPDYYDRLKEMEREAELEENPTTREYAIEDLEQRLVSYRAANRKHPGLWDEEIRDTQNMIRRLRAGMSLTPYQRGKRR